MNKEHCPF